MRLIDADALYREYQSVVCHDIACAECKAVDKDTGECRVDYLISDAPTIDAVSVVRCKECKHYNFYRKQFSMERRGDGLCDRMNCVMNDDDFCSHGEREGE